MRYPWFNENMLLPGAKWKHVCTLLRDDCPAFLHADKLGQGSHVCGCCKQSVK